MIKPSVSSLLLLTFISIQLIAQEANHWIFGTYELDFNGDSVVVTVDPSPTRERGMGIISDKNGSLLFYTDGYSVWNRDHQLMPNGDSLLSSYESESNKIQESIIIPKPGNSNQYYIFSVEPWNGQATSGLYYSEVDLSLQKGAGDVTKKAVKLLSNTTSNISATLHSNQKDVWLLTHQHGTNHYYAYLITAQGISQTPIVNQIGQSHSFWGGQLKFSPDGKKVTCSNTGRAIDLFDFNNSRGTLSNHMSLELPANRSCEGVEFSPDAKKLYVVQFGSSGESGLYQFDLSESSYETISQSRTLLIRERHNGFRQMQLAPNGNIYITKGGGGGGTAHLGVISNTNAPASEVIVEENGLYLEGGSSFVNYTPNFIQNYFFKTGFDYNNTCQSSPTTFTVTNEHLLDSVEWFFGQGSSSNSLIPEFTYQEAGKYQVDLVSYYENKVDTASRILTINPFPLLELGNDTTVCFGRKLFVEDRYQSYYWSTGDTTNTISVKDEGWYKLTVTNDYECVSTDSLYVNVVDLPIITLPDTVLLNAGDSVLLSPGTFESYAWSTGETSPTIYVSEAGWHSVVVTNAAGCRSAKSVFLTYSLETEPKKEPDWVWLNPKPSGLSGKDTHFVNDSIGFILKNSTLLRTTNGGNYWEEMMAIKSGNRISFKNQFGYIIGNYGTIYKSTHNGDGWNKLITDFNDDLISVTVIHQDTLRVTSRTKLFVSDDGGDTWETREIKDVEYSNPYYRLEIKDSYFTSADVGHLACIDGKILKTTDGGKNWYVTESSNHIPSDFFRIVFVNEKVGFASQEHDDIYKTVDGGETWAELGGHLDAIYSMHFLNEEVGFIAGRNGAMHKTTDGGRTWSWIGFNGRISANHIYAVYFINEKVGFATGFRGRIIKTIDGGKSWVGYSPIYSDINQISFPSKEIGYALVGNTFYKTTNGGIKWKNIGPPVEGIKTTKFDFIDDKKGYAIVGGSTRTSGSSGSVYKTEDGGSTWSKVSESFEEFKGLNLNAEYFREGLYTIDFVNEDIGFVSGGYNLDRVFKTIDGGKTWKHSEDISFRHIQFLNLQLGYGLAYRRLYRTLDGGQTWNIVFEIDEDITSFHFVNDSVGYFVGEASLIYKTMDGGSSWKKLELPYEDYIHVSFQTNDIGYILDEEGTVYKTYDGGNNWSRVFRYYGLNQIVINNNSVYLFGEYGSILKGNIPVDDVSDITSSIHFYADSVSGFDSETVAIDIKVNDFTEIISVQATLEWDPQIAELAFIRFGALPTIQFTTNVVREGKMTFSWAENSNNKSTSLADSTILFSPHFRLIGEPDQESFLSFSSSIVPLTVFSKNGNLVDAKSNSGKLYILPLESISGDILTETNQPVEDAKVALKGYFSDSDTTDVRGMFELYGVHPYQPHSYTITAAKESETNITNGLTSLDLALIQRHILNIESLPTPYKLIAADVDFSNSITLADVEGIQDVILGNASQLPMGKHWTFIPKKYVFDDPLNPYPYDTAIVYNSVPTSTGHDFVGIKLGDVNDTWDPTKSRQEQQPLQFLVEEHQILPGSSISIPIKVREFNDVSSFQATLEWDPTVLSLVSAQGEGLSEMVFGRKYTEEGQLTLLWYDLQGNSTSLSSEETVFSVTFKVLGSIREQSNIVLTSSRTPLLAYDATNVEMITEATAGMVSVSESSNVLGVSEAGDSALFKLYQSEPNPFRDEVKFKFAVPRRSTVSLQVINAMGQVFYKTEGVYGQGIHIVSWDISNNKGLVLSPGVYYVRFITESFQQTIKIVSE
ncbi:MAG: YCF48-related protein [Cyclobacteriaceae bacterium]